MFGYSEAGSAASAQEELLFLLSVSSFFLVKTTIIFTSSSCCPGLSSAAPDLLLRCGSFPFNLGSTNTSSDPFSFEPRVVQPSSRDEQRLNPAPHSQNILGMGAVSSWLGSAHDQPTKKGSTDLSQTKFQQSHLYDLHTQHSPCPHQPPAPSTGCGS